jgi:hypothetical protein
MLGLELEPDEVEPEVPPAVLCVVSAPFEASWPFFARLQPVRATARAMPTTKATFLFCTIVHPPHDFDATAS